MLAVSYASSTRAWLRQRSEINQLSSEIEAQRAAVAALEEEKRRLVDPPYIKALARERFGWVMPGQTGYRVIGDDGEVLADHSTALSDPVDPGAPAGTEWWDTAWGSVEAAGEEPPPDAAEPSEDGGAPVGSDPADHIGRDGRERSSSDQGGDTGSSGQQRGSNGQQRDGGGPRQ